MNPSNSVLALQYAIEGLLPRLMEELGAANGIIHNALRVMSQEQLHQWAELNALARVDGDGAVRANERLTTLSAAQDWVKHDRNGVLGLFQTKL